MHVERNRLRSVGLPGPPDALNEAYKGVAMPMIARYAVSHLSRPLPMMRW
jgi:hypothetical protein